LVNGAYGHVGYIREMKLVSIDSPCEPGLESIPSEAIHDTFIAGN
jgi:hypothetical protein